MLPIDAAKTRLQTATPGSPRDAGVIRNLQMMYREGELFSCKMCIAPAWQKVHVRTPSQVMSMTWNGWLVQAA